MLRALFLFALSILAAPASRASGHAHCPAALHPRTLSPAAAIHSHAPGIVPRATLINPGEPDAAGARALHESSLAGFVIRTMLGFTANIGR